MIHKLAMILAAALSCASAVADTRWTANGVAVAPQAQSQQVVRAAGDGADGVFVGWTDRRNGAWSIMVQHLAADGTPQWAVGGIRAGEGPGEQSGLVLIGDGAGGVVAVWQEDNGSDLDLRAQRLSATGTPQWGASGAAVCTAAGDQRLPQALADGAGGFRVLWQDERSGQPRVYTQRLNAAGAGSWGADGKPLSGTATSQRRPRLASDGLGGFFAVWEEEAAGRSQVQAQRVDAAGSLAWGADGLLVAPSANGQVQPVLVVDGAGGVVCAWAEQAAATGLDLGLQRLNAFGAAVWAAPTLVCGAVGDQLSPLLAPDEAGGVYVVWTDLRSGSPDAWIQRVDALGAALWGADGAPVAPTAAWREEPIPVSDDFGNVYVLWQDRRSGGSGSAWDLYAQLFAPDGSRLWAADGDGFCVAVGAQGSPHAAPDGAGGLLVAWPDRRDGVSNAYAQILSQAPTPVAVTLTIAPNPSTWGEAVTVDVAVTATQGIPTGQVDLRDGAALVTTLTLSGGHAAFPSSAWTSGTHPLVAAYAGSYHHTPGTSSVNNLLVQKATPTLNLVSSVNPSAYAQAVQFTATLSLPGATGNVQFLIDGSPFGPPVALVLGQAVSQGTATLWPGSHLIRADYAGDQNVNGAVAQLTQSVDGIPTTTTLSAAPNPSVFSAAVTFHATVTSAYGTPNGTVRFFEGPVELGAASLAADGSGDFTTTTLPTGTHGVVARYAANATFQASDSEPWMQNVQPAPTSASVSSAPNPSEYGLNATFTAQVTAVGLTPTGGTVTFRDGVAAIGVCPLSAGAATVALNTLGLGAHAITAEYSGTANLAGSSSPASTHTVIPTATVTTLTSTPNPSTYGQTVTLSAAVTSAVGTPAGAVTFRDGAAVLGVGALDAGGVALLNTAALAGGSHSLTAAYEGFSTHAGSTSVPGGHTVNPAPTATTLSSAPSPSVFGQLVTLTATVSSAAGPPAGVVTFYDGAAALGSASLNAGGVATWSAPALAAGIHLFSAAYQGSNDHLPSTSTTLVHAVNPAPTAAALTSAPNPSVFGQLVTLTTTVTAAPGSPTGSASFLDGSTLLGSANLNAGGVATLTVAPLSVGLHSLSASYSGDQNYQPVVSPAVGHQIDPAATTTALASSANPVCPDRPLTFTATVTSVPPGAGVPTGAVVFLDGPTSLGTSPLGEGAQAVLTVPGLSSGEHAVTAHYLGESRFQESISPAWAQIVDVNAGIESVNFPTRVCAGERATLTVTTRGTGPFIYQWFESADGIDFTPVAGAVEAVYVTEPLTGRRCFKVVLTGACRNADQIVCLDVLTPPAITQQPVDTAVRSWQSATLTLGYTGTEPVRIQWYEGPPGDVSRPVPQATKAVFQTPPLERETAYWARLSNSCDTVDTAAAVVSVFNLLYAPHAAANELWWTKLHLVNAGDTVQAVALDAYDAAGANREHVDLPPLAPWAKAEIDVATVFSSATLSGDIWVQATGHGNLKGVLDFGTSDGESRTVLPLSEQGGRKVVFPYVALTDPAAGNYYTGLTLVNIGEAVAETVLEGFDEAGDKLAETTIAIPAHGKYVRLLSEAFPALEDPRLVRSVRVSASQPLVGFELFGSLLEQALAGLPAVAVDEASGGGIYHGLCYPEVPDDGAWYTGLTFSCFSDSAAGISAEVYDAAGLRLGTEAWTLAPRQQLTREFFGLFDPVVYANAAHALVGSYQPIVGFALVLSRTLPFRFDGLLGLSAEASQLIFPCAAVERTGLVRLRLINPGNAPVTADVSVYAADGSVLGTVPVTLEAHAAVNLDLGERFAAFDSPTAWVRVEGDNVLFGDIFAMSDDDRTLIIAAGLPER